MNTRAAVVPYWLETLIAFKLCWAALVFGAGTGILPALALLAFSLARHASPWRALRPVLATAALGSGIDLAFTMAGVYAFPGSGFPLWLLVLWLAFAHALHHGFTFLKRWPIAAVALFGAVCGPASYLLGRQLDVVEFPLGLGLTLAILAAAWALLLPLALWMARVRAQESTSIRGALLLACAAVACLSLAPTGVHASGDTWRMHGEARMSVLFRTIYDIRLYTTGDPTMFRFPGQQPYKLELHYRMNIPASLLLRETRKQWQAQDVDAPPAWISTLQATLPSVKAGDRLALEVARDGSTLLHNDVPVARLEDQDLVEAFAGIWLAAGTSEPALRRQLLGIP